MRGVNGGKVKAERNAGTVAVVPDAAFSLPTPVDTTDLLRLADDGNPHADDLLPAPATPTAPIGLSPDATAAAVVQWDSLLWSLAHKWLNMGINHTLGIDVADLYGEAVLGLMQAAKKYDPARGAQFSTYAVWYAERNCRDYVRREHGKGFKTAYPVKKKKGEARLARLAAAAKGDGSYHFAVMMPVVSLSADARQQLNRWNSGWNDGGNWVDNIADRRIDSPTDTVCNRIPADFWSLVTRGMDARSARMVVAVYRDGQRYADVGRAEGVTRSRVGQVVMRAVREIGEKWPGLREWLE